MPSYIIVTETVVTKSYKIEAQNVIQAEQLFIEQNKGVQWFEHFDEEIITRTDRMCGESVPVVSVIRETERIPTTNDGRVEPEDYGPFLDTGFKDFLNETNWEHLLRYK